MSMSRFTNGLNKIFDFFKEAITEEQAKNRAVAGLKTEPVVLTAEKLRELKWMTSSQLAALFQDGKIETRIDDTEDAYRELKWFDEEQIAAIFGKDVM